MESLIQRIQQLKRSKNAVILAHNYQRPQIQDIADFIGDSLGLSRAAAQTDADLILFCGVNFMAETAAILNPDKKVLIPDPGAICPMAELLKLDQLREAKRAHPDAEVVLYINTLAEAKAQADCICTSANAPLIVSKMSSSKILFGPDHNLAYYVQIRVQKQLICVPEYGLCPTHHQISEEDLLEAKQLHPNALVVVHPECIPEIQAAADQIASTEGMVKYCIQSKSSEFIIGTELGLLHRLRKACPGKQFHPLSPNAICPQMKMHTLRKLLRALELEHPTVRVEPKIAAAAREAIEHMLDLSE